MTRSLKPVSEGQVSTILVTGSSDGIGRETAAELARLGYYVIVHGRTAERAEAARRQVIERSGNKSVAAVVGDFARLAEVAAMARDVESRFPKLRVLINNAGIKADRYAETEDGFESTFQVNHLAPALLTRMLIPVLEQNAPARIVNVSSMTHASVKLNLEDLQMRRGFRGFEQYSHTKLMNLLFTKALAARLAPDRVTANALHPGVISTKLLHSTFSGGAPTGQGAKTPVYLATSEEVAGVTGRYYVDARKKRPSREAQNERAAERLWEVTDELLVPWIAPSHAM